MIIYIFSFSIKVDQVQQEKASLEAEKANDEKVYNIYAAILRLFSKSSCAVPISDRYF